MFDPLPLHAAENEHDLSTALSLVLGAANIDARWSVVFRQVTEPQRVEVYLTTAPGLSRAEQLELPGADLRRALLPDDDEIPLVRAGDGSDTGLFGHALTLLEARRNHYGYLILHDPVESTQRAALLAVSDHLALALYALQTRGERERLQQLDGRKVSLMMQASSVVLRELDLERAMYKLIELAVDAIHGEVGCVALTARGGSELHTHASWGIDEHALSQLRLHDGRLVGELVAAGGMVCLFRNAQELQELQPCEALERISSVVALPVSASCGVRGCLLIANAPRIEREDVDLLKLLTEFASTSIDNAMRHLDSMERESLAEQLRLAGSIQQALLPEEPPRVRGVSLEGCNLPCDDSSGDYYDYFRIDDTRVGFVIADATGHGIGAALIATTARAALRALLHRQPFETLDLSEILRQLNELAEEDMKDDKFITLFAGVFDGDTGTLTYASAGHDPPMIVYRRDADSIERLEATGMPLGMFGFATYDAVQVAPMAPGDVMLLFTDGVDEARSPAGEQFGLERVEAYLRGAADSRPRELIAGLIDAHQSFTRNGKREDDITMICARVGDSAAELTAQDAVT
ncbi:MAG: PP2C family protein-serine/threonine phosphatase [Pseudomonadota bacterium]